jgi:hypothetical protein
MLKKKKKSREERTVLPAYIYLFFMTFIVDLTCCFSLPLMTLEWEERERKKENDYFELFEIQMKIPCLANDFYLLPVNSILNWNTHTSNQENSKLFWSNFIYD